MIDPALARRLVSAALATHVVLTIVENSPVAHASLATRHRWLSGLPHWKFFTSAPGGERVHLVLRHRERDDAEWSGWGELTTMVDHVTWSSVLWDPDTRLPKTLFDAVGEVRGMERADALQHAAPGHPAYDAVAAAVAQEAQALGATSTQFMIAVSRVRGGERQVRPVLMSEPIRAHDGG